MEERSATTQPSMVPEVPPTAGTMFAAIYGDHVPHEWRDADSEHDAYQLFHQRSLAMGWLDDRSAGGGSEDRIRRATGLWAMNDAGWTHPTALAPETSLVAWFQVETSAIADDRPLPVQPFLQCAEAVIAKAGTLSELSAVQILLPVQGIDPTVRPPYASVPALMTTHWFAERAPRTTTSVTIGLDSGREPTVPAIAPEIKERLDKLDQDVFSDIALSGYGGPPVEPLFDDTLWNGPLQHNATFHGELAEWSLDAIGWLASMLADLSAQSGVTFPLVLTVQR